ncbi:MAG: proline dehydrogenase family protein [Cytophagaceae bacterium]|jgi:proline dehydrogenase|nr:proline dehydrogenase family protein [Cytophagaceae bacterium]
MIPDFKNTESAFRIRSTAELQRMKLLFQLMGSYELTKIGTFLIKAALKWHFPIKKLIKHTLFKQFCGGETLEECQEGMEKRYHSGVLSIPDYSAEAGSNPDYAAAFEEIKRSIYFVSQHRSCAFAVFKASALGPSAPMEKHGISPLRPEEQSLLQQTKQYMQELCTYAAQLRVKLLIDAEESWIQDWIDEQVIEISAHCNREEAWIYPTLQMYRRDGMQRLQHYERCSRELQFKPAVKLVRGAYMEKENARAQQLGYVSPIHTSKADTDACFNKGLEYCVQQGIALCAGTHNENSTGLLCSLYAQKKEDVYFAQLLGMSDNLSFVLAENKFPVAKYVPYGPVELVMPYLFRRADENTSVTGEVGRELRLIRKELERRK